MILEGAKMFPGVDVASKYVAEHDYCNISACNVANDYLDNCNQLIHLTFNLTNWTAAFSIFWWSLNFVHRISFKFSPQNQRVVKNLSFELLNTLQWLFVFQ